MNDEPDDLAGLLGPPAGEPSADLRAALLNRTEWRLAADRWLRRGVIAAGIATLVFAGGVAGWLARTPVAHTPGSSVPEVVVVTVPVPVPIPERSSTIPVLPPLSPSEVELRAEQENDAAAAANLYRQAGDAFLRSEDYRNATRCYRLFLERGGDNALAIEEHDTWLLTSLKNAAFKEKSNVVPKTDG